MQQRWRSALARYGAAAALVVLAALIVQWFGHLLGGASFGLFMTAVVIAAWYGGLGPSLLALVLSLAISTFFFGPPPNQPPAPLHQVLIGLIVYFFVGVVTAVLSDSMRAARRRAEVKAQEAVAQQEQLQTTLACISDAVIVADGLGRVTMMNPVAEQLTGWKEGDAIGLPLSSVFRLTSESTGEPADRPAVAALRSGETATTSEPCLLGAKGGPVPIEASAAPIRDAGGTMHGVVQIFRDVTLRRQAEEAQRDADRRKDEFLATLAHELRNPLAPVLSAVEVLQLGQPPDEHSRWCHEVIRRQVDYLKRLIDDLLDISRITQDKLELRKEPLELKAIVDAAIELSAPAITDRGHHLTVELPDEPVPLLADRVRLAQVLMNLIHNAAKYTDPGGKIEVSAQRHDHEVAIRVRDTGRGIPADKLPQLFQMFYQVDRSTNGSQGGLGIGLALVRRLTEMHGGRVTATSGGTGQGSQFEVRLPVLKLPPRQAPPSPLPAIQAATKRRVLVVDDNKDAADSLKMVLRALGHEVHTAYDGEEGIEQAAAVRPEVVFLDLGMPKLNGFEAARQIRENAWGKELRLVAVTGWGQEEDRNRSRAAGFDDHLAKPVELVALQAILDSPHGPSREIAMPS